MTRERVRELIPFVRVADVRGSIGFYRTWASQSATPYEHEGRLAWTALDSDRARLMLARAIGRVDRDSKPFSSTPRSISRER